MNGNGMVKEYHQSDMVPSYMPRRLKRNQTFPTIGLTSTQILGPNPKRWAVFISAPNANFTDQQPKSVIANAVSTATTGVKLSFTVPANTQAILNYASMIAVAGTGVIANVQLVRGGITVSTAIFTTNGTIALGLPLQAGDVVQWNVTTPIAASTTDFTLGITQTQGFGRFTVSLAQTAVLDQGMNQYPGQTPLIMLYESLGDALKEDMFAISASGTPTIGVWDFFT